MSNYNKVKLLHIVIYLCIPIVLLTSFSLNDLILSVVLSWILCCLGFSVSLHRFSSHRSFKPKTRVHKWIILYFGVLASLGTAIDFSAGHRNHHKFSDSNLDPYNITGSLWHKFKLFWYWFPTYKINPLVIKDLYKDNDHQFFNKNYWKILLPYPILLLWFGGLTSVVYYYMIPVLYCILVQGYVTVIAHLPGASNQPFKTNDNSWDSYLMQWLSSEGLHNTHHAFQQSANYCKNHPGLLDPAYFFVKMFSK